MKKSVSRTVRVPGVPFDCKSAVCKPEACSDDVEDGQRQEHAPAEIHELIVAETRHCAAHPDVEKEEKENFDAEPAERNQCVRPGVGGRRKHDADGAGPSA